MLFSVKPKGPFQEVNGGFNNLPLKGNFLSCVFTVAHLFKEITLINIFLWLDNHVNRYC